MSDVEIILGDGPRAVSRRSFIRGVVAAGATVSSAYLARPVILATRSGGAMSLPMSAMVRPSYARRAYSAARMAEFKILL